MKNTLNKGCMWTCILQNTDTHSTLNGINTQDAQGILMKEAYNYF